jgi:hypothetical protein
MLTITIDKLTYTSSPQGSECVFVEILDAPGLLGGNLGLKIFLVSREAQRARSKQHTAWRRGIAPAVGPFVVVSITGLGTRHGYLTQVADRHRDPTDIELGWLAQQLERAGLSPHDLGPDNVGFINDRPVYLDFGDHST